MPSERVTYPKLHGWTQAYPAGAPWERFEVPAELDMATDEARGRALPCGTVVAVSSSSMREYYLAQGYGRHAEEIPDGPMDVLWEGLSLGGSAAEDAPRLGDDPRRGWVATWRAKGAGNILLPLLGRAPLAAFTRAACAIAAMCLDPDQPGAEGKATRDAVRRALEVAEKWAIGGADDEAMALHVERVRSFDYDFARVALCALEAARAHPHAGGAWARDLAEAAARSSFRVSRARAGLGRRGRARRQEDPQALQIYEAQAEAEAQAKAIREVVGLGEVMLGHALYACMEGAK